MSLELVSDFLDGSRLLKLPSTVTSSQAKKKSYVVGATNSKLNKKIKKTFFFKCAELRCKINKK